MMLTGWSPADRMRSLLSQIRILRCCSSADLDALGRSAEIARFAPGEWIDAQCESPDAIALVAFGRVRLVVIGEGGRELILTEVDAGGFFGDEALSGASTRRANALAIAETTIVSVPRQPFVSFLGAHPTVALGFCMQLSRQLHGACATVAGLGLLSVEDRLLHELEQLADRDGSPRHDGLLLHALPTHRELAARVGACRETVTRTFQSLARRGLVVSLGSSLLLTRAALQ
ncbi:MAG: Crp/Fnr family transcriptional regulator, partial [Polyangia bacterium]